MGTSLNDTMLHQAIDTLNANFASLAELSPGMAEDALQTMITALFFAEEGTVMELPIKSNVELRGQAAKRGACFEITDLGRIETLWRKEYSHVGHALNGTKKAVVKHLGSKNERVPTLPTSLWTEFPILLGFKGVRGREGKEIKITVFPLDIDKSEWQGRILMENGTTLVFDFETEYEAKSQCLKLADKLAEATLESS